MKYVLVTSITQSNLPAAYNTIYSFRKYHPDAYIYVYGDRPDAILKSLNVGFIEYAGPTNPLIRQNTFEKHHTGIFISDKCDAIVAASAGVIFTRSIRKYIVSAIVNNRVLGTTTFKDRLLMDPDFYIVPSNVVDDKLKRSVISGVAMQDPAVALIDSYYPILDQSIVNDIFVVKPGMTLIHTAKSIIKYTDNVWDSVANNDLWNEITEEFMRSVDEKSIHNS